MSINCFYLGLFRASSLAWVLTCGLLESQLYKEGLGRVLACWLPAKGPITGAESCRVQGLVPSLVELGHVNPCRFYWPPNGWLELVELT